VSTLVLDGHVYSAEALAEAGTLRIGLLGLGNVGSAVARLIAHAPFVFAPRGFAPAVTAALVRHPDRPRDVSVARITGSIDQFFEAPIDLVVEAIGGVDAPYHYVRRALDRGIPVVTANKSLVAAHGDELSRLARRRCTAFRFEASCIAGVPFLGTFERRPLASRISGVTAILNGTSNYILSAMTSAGASFEGALADAQRLGLAEPDPVMDVSGADAAEKLSILLRLFGHLVLRPAAIPAEGIDSVDADDLRAAADLNGCIKPVAYASWKDGAVRAFVGPAFVPRSHPLAHIKGLTNAIHLEGDHGPLCFSGPGAGPEVTAATLLDDVAEIASERPVRPPEAPETRVAPTVQRPVTRWCGRFPALPDAEHAC
jgi:homoserine dehydrogenase